MPSISGIIGVYHTSLETLRCESFKEYVKLEILPRFKNNVNRSWILLDDLCTQDPFAAQIFLHENRFFANSISTIEDLLVVPPATTEFLNLETVVVTAYNKLLCMEVRSMSEYHELVRIGMLPKNS